MRKMLGMVGHRVLKLRRVGFGPVELGGLAPGSVRESLAAQIPFPSRFGDPDEFAAFCEHIISNSYINGETFRLDAAVRMGAS